MVVVVVVEAEDEFIGLVEAMLENWVEGDFVVGDAAIDDRAGTRSRTDLFRTIAKHLLATRIPRGAEHFIRFLVNRGKLLAN